MEALRRIGVFSRDIEQDYGVAQLEKLFRRANIDFVADTEGSSPGALDMVLAMGGDGTVLRAMKAHPGTPVLAINYGNVGFLTQGDREHMDKVLVRLLSDDFKVEERLTLSVSHRGETYRCINEVVLKASTRMIKVEVLVNGRTIHTPRADGVIVGTPTGSTAYLLSTGAPIVVPDVDCIMLAPLNEYRFSSRTIIVPGCTKLELKLDPDREKDVGLSIDGGERLEVEKDEVIAIERSEIPARLVYFEGDYFFRNLRERLGW